MNFSQLGLDKWIVNNLKCLDYQTPTKVQDQVIPSILKGRNVIGISRTGTGKTTMIKEM